ncbi:MAG: hypothetical protein E6767_12850 [Dysgonomonas sp.]|nr:hypothetical protein [Dysgonomonas sp.]
MNVYINELINKYNNLIIPSVMEKITDKEIIELIDVLCPYWYDTSNYLLHKNSPKDPDIYHYEREIWLLGEKIRQCLSIQKRKRGQDELIDKVVEVLHTYKYKNGRVSFAFILEAFAYPSYSSQIRELLYDNDLQLQLSMIKAIRKMKILDLENEVKDILETSPYSWIRKQCENYLRMIDRTR